MIDKVRVRNNILFVSIAQIISFLLNIITFGIVARTLAVEDFGKFNYILAIIGFSAKLIDLGLNPIILRETTKNGKFNEFLGSAFYLKTVLIILFIVLMNVVLIFSKNSFVERILFNLFAFNIFFSGKYTNIRELLITPYKVSINMGIPMLLVLLDSVLFLFLTLFLKSSENALLFFGLIYVISNLPSTIILFLLIKKNYKVKFIFNKEILRKVVIMALPIYGYVVLMIIFGQIDIILLGHLNNDYAVGLYSSAIRLSNPFVIFASAITLTFFPILVRKHDNEENINKNVSSIVSILFLFSASIALFLFFHAKEIILIVFGEKYLLAFKPLKFLAIALVFMFLNFFIVDFFTAINKQKLNFFYGILINLISIPLYLIFLPKYSYVGASAIKLISIFFGNIFLLIFLLKNILLKVRITRIFIWVLITFSFFYIFPINNIFISIFVEGIFIIISILVLKIFSSEELEIIFAALNQQKLYSKIKYLISK